MRQPPGVSYSISRRWVAVTRALATALGARLILGIDLEADSAPLAAAEAQALSDGIGTRAISALEPGNEPELYRSWGWYCSSAGRPVTGRPSSYDFPAFVQDFSKITTAIPYDLPLAGPTVGIHTWFPGLPSSWRPTRACAWSRFTDTRCRTSYRPPRPSTRASATCCPTLRHKDLPTASRPTCESRMPAPPATNRRDEYCVRRTAAWRCRFVRVSIMDRGRAVQYGSCRRRRGQHPHIPRRDLRALPLPANTGWWQGFVSPEYYGMLMFAQAAPLGSRLLTSFTGTGDPVKAWATYTPDRTIRVVLINDQASPQTIALQAAGHTAPARLERLLAPSIHSVTGVTLGGQTFGPQTATGVLTGQPTTSPCRPPTTHTTSAFLRPAPRC